MNFSFLTSRNFLWYWLPPLAWCGVILCLSGDFGSSRHTFGILRWLLSWFPPLSPAHFDLIHHYLRKILGHFGNYAFLYFLWFRAFHRELDHRAGRALLCSLGFCLALALLDEGHQTLFASRSSSLRDVALDMAGAATTALITALWCASRARPAAKPGLLDRPAGE